MQPAARSVGIFRALKVGDLLCTVPTFRALRAAYPDAEITLISLPWARWVKDRFPQYLDSFIDFPGWPGLPEIVPDLGGIPRFLKELRNKRFDLLLQIHGSGEHVNDICALAEPRVLAGYFRAGAWCPDSSTFIEYPAESPEIWRQLALLCALGISAKGEELELSTTAEDMRELELALEGRRLPAELAVVHPGAADARRVWPSACFAAVADELSRSGLHVVITGGAPDREQVSAMLRQTRARCTVLAEKTTLGALAALVARSRIVVCNDTGVSHIAAALRTPSVVVFGKSDREGWPPADRQLHRFVTRFAGVTSDDVIREARSLLGSDKRNASAPYIAPAPSTHVSAANEAQA